MMVRSVSEVWGMPNAGAVPFEAALDLPDTLSPRPDRPSLGEQSQESTFCAFGRGTSGLGVFAVFCFILCVYSARWRFPGVKQFSVPELCKQLAVQFAFYSSFFFWKNDCYVWIFLCCSYFLITNALLLCTGFCFLCFLQLMYHK